jgi:sugar (pentulose or hexulose) kinase
MRFAVIDLGGSFIKSALAGGAELEHVQRTPFPPFLDHPTKREIALDAIARVFDAHVGRLLRFQPQALFVSTQMHGFVLGDRFISWQDQRALDGAFEELQSRIDDPDRIGRELGPGHAATVLFAMRPDAGTPLPLPNALIGSDTADETLAHSFGVYDIRKRTWDQALLDAFELRHLAWPRVTRWNEIIGTYRDLPVYSPVGDQQAALLGAGLQAGELSLNIGTGSQVSVLLDELRSGDFKVRPFFGDRFLATVTHIPAGRALNRLQRTINTPWSDIDAAVDALDATDLVVELSFYRGRIDNIRESNFTAGHLFLAAYENMATNYLAAALRLHPDHDWGTLVLSGGLAHKAARLRKLVSSRLQRNYRLSVSEDETLAGLARLGMAALGSATV